MSFDASTVAAIAASLKSGHYNLLLGAGASMDSRNTVGLLPGGNSFRLEVCRLKGAHDNSPLQRVFSTLSPAEVKEYVVGRFKNCSAGPSLTRLTKFIWRRAFTFNIDDALEAAYTGSEARQDIIEYHFNDDLGDSENLASLPIIHLHGSVGAADKGFVFSRAEYVRQIQKINPWMVILTQLLPVEPFIIAGTSLDEVDLDFYLAHRTAVTARDDRGPSILVEPNPDSVTENDCKKYNLLLYKGTLEQFFEYLDAAIPERPTPLELIPRDIRRLLPSGVSKAAALSFFSDFEMVPGLVEGDGSASRFLYGHPPTWQDLAGNVDIGRAASAMLIDAVESALKDDSPGGKIIFLSDQTGSGKTTVLRRCAFELARKNIKTLLCSALSRIEPLSTGDLLDQIDEKLVIIVDNFADQVNAIEDLANRIEKPDVVFLCGERSYRSRYVEQVLLGTEFETVGGSLRA